MLVLLHRQESDWASWRKTKKSGRGCFAAPAFPENKNPKSAHRRLQPAPPEPESWNTRNAHARNVTRTRGQATAGISEVLNVTGTMRTRATCASIRARSASTRAIAASCRADMASMCAILLCARVILPWNRAIAAAKRQDAVSSRAATRLALSATRSTRCEAKSTKTPERSATCRCPVDNPVGPGRAAILIKAVQSQRQHPSRQPSPALCGFHRLISICRLDEPHASPLAMEDTGPAGD